MSQDDAVSAAVAWLLSRASLMAPEDLPAAADEAARRMGAAGCRIYLVSRDQRGLRPLQGRGTCAELLTLDGSLPGRAFRLSEVVVGTTNGARLWLPLLGGAERLGVCRLEVDDEADLERLLEPGLTLAAVLAELVGSKSHYTDAYEKLRRSVPMGVPAELLWRQLPPTAFSTDRFVLTVQLEPWHEIGGDAFDYSLDADTLHLAVFDGMGHGLGAALLASVALAAYRNARRGDLSLTETAAVIDQVLAEQFGEESFVTGVFGRLDLVTGSLSLLCAAHPAPLLIRDGRPVGEAKIEAGTPLGFGGRDDVVLETPLQPGDRLLMFSDGVVEARSAAGEFFGLDRLLDLVTRQESNGQPPPETLRRLIVAVLDHQDDMLQDDATVLLLEWAGDPRALLPTPAG